MTFLDRSNQAKNLTIHLKLEVITMAKKLEKRRAWTVAEVRGLKAMAKTQTPARRIAKKLKRTEGATWQKAFSIGLSLESRS